MYQTVRFNDGDRWFVAIKKDERKLSHMVLMDDCGVRKISVPLEETRHAVQLERRGQPYPLDRMARKLSAFGRERGISDGAKEFLAAAAA